MNEPVSKQPIIPTAPYSRAEAIAITGFSLSTFIREEERGRLYSRRKGRRVYFLGADLLTWLGAETQPATSPAKGTVRAVAA